jgi:hypothetical protein
MRKVRTEASTAVHTVIADHLTAKAAVTHASSYTSKFVRASCLPCNQHEIQIRK